MAKKCGNGSSINKLMGQMRQQNIINESEGWAGWDRPLSMLADAAVRNSVIVEKIFGAMR